MTAHTIRLPDRLGGAKGALRTLVWDDEAGTVSGDHSDVDGVQEWFQHPERWTAVYPEGILQLENPRHIPEDFKKLIVFLFVSWPDLPRIVWPPTLADVVPTPLDPGSPLAEGDIQ